MARGPLVLSLLFLFVSGCLSWGKGDVNPVQTPAASDAALLAYEVRAPQGDAYEVLLVPGRGHESPQPAYCQALRNGTQGSAADSCTIGRDRNRPTAQTPWTIEARWVGNVTRSPAFTSWLWIATYDASSNPLAFWRGERHLDFESSRA